MSIKIYGIPNCGTCKKALKWLQDHQVEYNFIDTKVNPPTREVVQDWVETLGSKPMRNTSGQSYRALGDEKKDWTEQQWIEAFTKDAMLLKRPLFVRNSTAVLVGFKDQDNVIQEKLGL
jgi:arsenate reductase (glutaredoxin)